MGFNTTVEELRKERCDALEDAGDLVQGSFEQIVEVNTCIKHLGGCLPTPLTVLPSNDLLGGAAVMPIIAGLMAYDMVSKRFRH